MKTFLAWYQECESVAVEHEWCLDPAWRWKELYDEGLTPEAAVDELFREVAKRLAKNALGLE